MRMLMMMILLRKVSIGSIVIGNVAHILALIIIAVLNFIYYSDVFKNMFCFVVA